MQVSYGSRNGDAARIDIILLQPVWSCFGGLGDYRMECLKAASYGGDDCEHVVFHRRLRQQGLDRLFLNPSQIVVYENPR